MRVLLRSSTCRPVKVDGQLQLPAATAPTWMPNWLKKRQCRPKRQPCANQVEVHTSLPMRGTVFVLRRCLPAWTPIYVQSRNFPGRQDPHERWV